jgi:hypothetical protein
MIIFDADDFACSHVISDQCQSHDCRDKLDEFHYTNPSFKATLFAIPGEMTYELCEWCRSNNSWIQLAVHGFLHSSNYECSEMSYDEFDQHVRDLQPMIDNYFVKGFKAPGWQISDDCYLWLKAHGWWLADQSYNNMRRANLAKEIPTYVNNNGNFVAWNGSQDTDLSGGMHFHCWDCVGNGVYELSNQIKDQIKDETNFKFVSEVLL